MIEIVKYESSYKSRWDDFVKRSKNGTFMFYRDYMEYHSDRFIDSSLLFFDEDALIAVMPANISENILYSHGGLTFGGIVSDHKMKLSVMVQLFEQLTAYLKAQGSTKLIYKAIPHIYHNFPAEEDLYALFRFDARLVRRDASSAICLKNRLGFSRDKRRGIKSARKNELVVKESNDFTAFMSLMEGLVQSKYKAKPTHRGDELNLLASRFPDNIKLFAVFESEEMLAGVVTYENKNVTHTQYIGSVEQGREKGAAELIIDYLINEYCSNKEYFDFGISTEQNGRYLNATLAYYKESFGARAAMYDFYKVDLI
jgi:hypothetical protein